MPFRGKIEVQPSSQLKRYKFTQTHTSRALLCLTLMEATQQTPTTLRHTQHPAQAAAGHHCQDTPLWGGTSVIHTLTNYYL